MVKLSFKVRVPVEALTVIPVDPAEVIASKVNAPPSIVISPPA